METPGSAQVPPEVPPEVSPPSLEPLVAAVAALHELGTVLGATAGDLALAPTCPSLRGALVALAHDLARALRPPPAFPLSTILARATHDATGDATAPGANWPEVVAAARAWQDEVAAAAAAWAGLSRRAAELGELCQAVATDEGAAVARLEATTARLEAAKGRCHRGLGDLLAAAATRDLLAFDKEEVATALSEHEARVARGAAALAEAAEERGEAAEARHEAGVAAGRARRAREATGPLRGLAAACEGAARLHRGILGRVRAAVAATEEAARGGHGGGGGGGGGRGGVLAGAEGAERAWSAAGGLGRRHLGGIVGDVAVRLAGGGTGAGTGPEVAERIRRARGDIPALLEGK
ncbi:spidroin-1-like isoform X2 [Pseudopipra pipra]|uniref:spidroin-1-like isoform X2 n=1 Tax=Pseudopipra pipra TaxID=415032 RepID=UPI003139AE8F